jgi:hypothetical protein
LLPGAHGVQIVGGERIESRLQLAHPTPPAVPIRCSKAIADH